MPWKDPAVRKARQKELSRAHYLRNREAKIANAVITKRKYRLRNREIVDEFKSKRGCRRCKMRNPICLEFHHLRDKHANIADAIVKGWKVTRLMAEIAKCILLCANCHRIHTHEERQRAKKGVQT